MIWCAVGSFGDQLRAFEAKTKRKQDTLGRRVALDVFRRVIFKTPVDKGPARANWQPSIGAPSSGVVDATDTDGAATVAKVKAVVARMHAGDVIYLANNLPYIMKLEEGGYPDGPKTVGGFSRKAPAGMVALTVQEFQQIVKQIGIELSTQ